MSFGSPNRFTRLIPEDSLVWEPNEQVEFTSIPNKITVEKNAGGRMRQMKSIASQFSVTMVRQTSAGLDALHNGTTIWQVAPHPPRADRKGLGYTVDSKTRIDAPVEVLK